VHDLLHYFYFKAVRSRSTPRQEGGGYKLLPDLFEVLERKIQPRL